MRSRLLPEKAMEMSEPLVPLIRNLAWIGQEAEGRWQVLHRAVDLSHSRWSP